jgi:Methyltransferase domain
VIGADRFRAAYRRAVEDVSAFLTPERQQVLAAHNLALHPDHFDLRAYLRASERRYTRIVEQFDQRRPHSDGAAALDVGGFAGALPLALKRCGLDVTLVEEYGYYQGAFDELRDFLLSEGLAIWAEDFTAPLGEPPTRTYQLVMNLAMLEHLPSSPKPLLDNLRTVTDPSGLLFVDVPNIAYWPNRLKLLRGRSIHAPMELLYDSAPPYLGHHREYTRDDLATVLHRGGFRLLTVQCFNYTSLMGGQRVRDAMLPWLVNALVTRLSPTSREVLLAVAEPADVLRADPGHPRIAAT